MDFLLYHLEGAAKEELRLWPDKEKNTPEAVFRVPPNSFGEGLPSMQAMRKFFERRQKEKESILPCIDGAPVTGGMPQPWCSN